MTALDNQTEMSSIYLDQARILPIPPTFSATIGRICASFP
jgi:hypothetical protein